MAKGQPSKPSSSGKPGSTKSKPASKPSSSSKSKTTDNKAKEGTEKTTMSTSTAAIASSAIENVGTVIESATHLASGLVSNITHAVTDAIDIAGDVLLDDASSASPPTINKKGIKKNGASKVNEPATVVEAIDAIDPKIRTKSKKVINDASKVVVEKTKPLKRKAEETIIEPVTTTAQQVGKQIEEIGGKIEIQKKRKTAEDFMTSTEAKVGEIAGKVGQVLEGVVKDFGQASGLSKTAEALENVKPKVKSEKVVKKTVNEPKVGLEKEEDASQTTSKGKKGSKANESVKNTTNKVVGETVAKSKKAGAKAAATTTTTEIVEPVVSTTKRKAKEVAQAVEPTVKKAKKGAEEAVKRGKNAVVAALEPVDDSDKEEGKEEEQVELFGFEDDDDDDQGANSSDDESDAEDLAVAEAARKIDMSTVPKIAKDDKTVAARLKKAAKTKNAPVGTIYLGRIPHGFYEAEMKEYFSQFGDVTRVRLARNKKTGASKHYAYIEFASLPVAEIVAETMDNYLLMGRILRCNLIPNEDVHPQLWVGANKKFRPVPRARLEKVRHDKPRTKAQQAKADGKIKKRDAERRKKIKAAGIDYEYEGH